MRNYVAIIMSLVICGMNSVFGQNTSKTKHLFVLNIVNPGFVYEYSISDKSKISVNLGYGILMSYPELTMIQTNTALFLSSFFDMHYRYIYDNERRIRKNKNMLYDSGNFLGIRLVGRGKNYGSSLVRTDNIDFAVGPTWGIQRSIKRILLIFDLGPQLYMDTKDNYGFYPIMFEINIGYVLNH